MRRLMAYPLHAACWLLFPAEPVGVLAPLLQPAVPAAALLLAPACSARRASLCSQHPAGWQQLGCCVMLPKPLQLLACAANSNKVLVAHTAARTEQVHMHQLRRAPMFHA